MNYITINCNAKFVVLHITNITLKTCNALQCISITFSNTLSLVEIIRLDLLKEHEIVNINHKAFPIKNYIYSSITIFLITNE